MGRPISTPASRTNRAREWRERLGLKLKHIAERTGLAISTVQRVENGARGVTIDTLYAIARSMDLDLPQIVAWTTTPPPAEAEELTAILRELTPDQRAHILSIARTFRKADPAKHAA